MHVLDKVLDNVKSEFDVACSQVTRAARWELTNELNQFLRRLRQYRGENEWFSILLEAVTRFVPEAAVFSVAPSGLRLRAEHGLHLPAGLEFSPATGSAFASALSSRDPLVTLRVPAEVTEHLQSADFDSRAHLLPLTNADRVVAILFAASREYVDVNALELVTGVASVVLERSSNQALHIKVAEPTAPVTVRAPEQSSQPTGKESRALPAWVDLSTHERNQHLQAQRFARVTVAELQLAHPELHRLGRSEDNLYLYLKPHIDRARDQFRTRFMQTSSMVDYLHLELIRTSAEGEESKLGGEYPGPLA